MSFRTAVYQTKQIRELERIAQEKLAITSHMLMERAGSVAFEYMLKRWPHIKTLAVFCGGGNNGGDGYIVARLAHEHGIAVTIYQMTRDNHRQSAAKAALLACQEKNILIEVFDATKKLPSVDLIIDAICGIGLTDHLRENIIAAIEIIEEAKTPVFSLDVPTGLNADTGSVLGKALHATATITFIGLKLGLLTGHGNAYTGELICHDLELPADLFLSVNPVANVIQLNTYAAYLKPRSRDWHKGLSGHVLIVGGDDGYSGAPRMAAEAALRIGAGLVSIATRPENVSVMNNQFPEIMSHGIKQVEQLALLINKADVIVLGPGLGQSDWSRSVWQYVIEKKLPMVVDADGLNLLAERPLQRHDWVLTPHPGEASRLLNQAVAVIQDNRLSALRTLNERYGGVTVLKGAGTLVLGENSMPGVCDKGNPGMATAGMGDILSGVIGGLIAQGIPLADAASLGVLLHAMAGDFAANAGERGMIATDLMPYLQRLANPFAD